MQEVWIWWKDKNLFLPEFSRLRNICQACRNTGKKEAAKMEDVFWEYEDKTMQFWLVEKIECTEQNWNLVSTL